MTVFLVLITIKVKLRCILSSFHIRLLFLNTDSFRQMFPMWTASLLTQAKAAEWGEILSSSQRLQVEFMVAEVNL